MKELFLTTLKQFLPVSKSSDWLAIQHDMLIKKGLITESEVLVEQKPETKPLEVILQPSFQLAY